MQKRLIHNFNLQQLFIFLFVFSSCSDKSTLQYDVTDPNKSEISDIDGNIYITIKIGNQWWMAENLRVSRYSNGDSIPNVSEDSLWLNLKSGAYCFYYNYDWDGYTYGNLYNWYAVNDNRSLAPEGWHIPTDEEWKELEVTLGMSQSEADGFGCRGIDTGGKLKEEGNNHWQHPNVGATNSTDFTALATGIRMPNGSFLLRRYMTVFWTSTPLYNDLTAYYRHLNHDTSGVYRRGELKEYGFSVRCVKD